jgi:hypothetical protein
VEAKKTGGTAPTQSLGNQIELPFDGNGAIRVTAGQKWEGGFNEAQSHFDSGSPISPNDISKARYRAVVQYYPDTTNNQSVSARILVSWPATVDPLQTGKKPSGSVDTVTAFVAP